MNSSLGESWLWGVREGAIMLAKLGQDKRRGSIIGCAARLLIIARPDWYMSLNSWTGISHTRRRETQKRAEWGAASWETVVEGKLINEKFNYYYYNYYYYSRPPFWALSQSQPTCELTPNPSDVHNIAVTWPSRVTWGSPRSQWTK